MKPEKLQIGQEKIFMQPKYIFGMLLMDYEKVKITKFYQKSAGIEKIEEFGVTHGDTSIAFEKLEKYYFDGMKDALKWNKQMLSGTIKVRQKELSHLKQSHPEFKDKETEIKLLHEYLKLMDNFSVENYNKISDNFHSFLNKQTKKSLI